MNGDTRGTAQPLEQQQMLFNRITCSQEKSCISELPDNALLLSSLSFAHLPE
jgi:hypothetical protein